MMDESLVAMYPDLERNHFWWATRRALIATLIDELDGQSAMRILDVGCGSGMTASTLASTGAAVVGIDLEVHAGETLADGVRLIEGDYLIHADALGEFDVVLALDAIEHFSEEADVLQAIVGNLAPGGHVIITVPAYRFLWSSHDETNKHYRRYTERGLRSALDGAGLAVLRVGYIFMALTLPKLLLAAWERIRRGPTTTGTELSAVANGIAAKYFRWETEFARKRSSFLPFGTTVVGVARREEPKAS